MILLRVPLWVDVTEWRFSGRNCLFQAIFIL